MDVVEYNSETEYNEKRNITASFDLPFENFLHDMKTPMSIMYAYINELEDKQSLDTGVITTVSKIKKYWFKVMKLITDVSDFKRIGNGVLIPSFKNLDIVYLVRELTNSTKVLSDKKNIAINFSSDIITCVMAADKNMIERILLNLLSNSIKFTENGGNISVHVSANNGSIFITVKDNGIGIESDKIRMIFDRYYTDNSERNTQGIGLGLFIVKELVALLNGAIFIQSTNGTEITVSIPIRVIDDPSPEQNLFSNFYSDNIIQIELSDEY